MTTIRTSWYNEAEPIEMFLVGRGGNSRYEYHLTLWRTDHGTVSYSLGLVGGIHNDSYRNLQCKRDLPGKAVKGWQMEAIEAAGSGLYDVVSAR